MKIRIELNGLQDVAKLVGISLLIAAAVAELRKPAGARTWHGRLAGWVPYDLRPPTVGRMIRQWWDPGDPRLITDTPLGVGWTVNFGRLARQLGIRR